MSVIIFSTFFFKPTSYQLYFFFDLFDLLFEALVLLLGLVVLLLQFVGVHVASPAEEPTDVIHCLGVAGLIVFLVQLHQDLGQLVDSSRFFQVVFEFSFLGVNSLSIIICLPLTLAIIPL